MNKPPSIHIFATKTSQPNDNTSQEEERHPIVKDECDSMQIDDSKSIEEIEAEIPLDKSALLSLFHVPTLPINNVTNSAALAEVNETRAKLYHSQYQRTKKLYLAPIQVRPTYLIQALKTQYIEYQRFMMAKELDQRHVTNTEEIGIMWQQVHIVDDLIAEIVRHMPAQMPVGWQLTSGSRNHLKLPTVGRLRDTNSIADQTSINSYVLGHFGVMSYTFDRGYFIGHVLGYLFCCYYFAHLSIAYGVTPLPRNTVPGYSYKTLDTPMMVRLLQGLDLHSKRRIYQLAVLCARLSEYRTDKRIEKMLIAEVNDFDKKVQQTHLDDLLYQGAMPENLDELDDIKQKKEDSGDDDDVFDNDD